MSLTLKDHMSLRNIEQLESSNDDDDDFLKDKGLGKITRPS